MPDRPAPPPAPTATYRLQLGPAFGFADAAATVPRLAALGVSHLHLSPILQAAPGSTHGYDVVDHGTVGRELGGEDGLRALAATAHAAGLGLVVDTVPNHMAVPAPEWLNRPLWSVLRDGPTSEHARWFDIDWPALGDRILLPVLAAPPADALGDLAVEPSGGPDGEPVLRYFDHAFPLRAGTAGLPLPELLEHQWYRLDCWRRAADQLNHRRFFTISSLIAIRAEDPEVFAATHRLLLRLIREGVVDGLRIDHPDGLTDPRGYLRRLAEATGGTWTAVEKILTGGETLPEDWPVAGTTGYDTMRRIDGVLLDPDGLARLEREYRAQCGTGPYAAEAAAARRGFVTAQTGGELVSEVSRLVRAAGRTDALRDRDPEAVRRALADMLTAYPRYRPYPVPGEEPTPDDARDVSAAAAAAASPEADRLRELVLGRAGRGPEEDAFGPRFAQTCAAVAAKGVEDTAFYRWYALSSRNEVGGGPGEPPCGPEEFHAHAARLQRTRPTGLTALTTHDTKRSADVRARLAVLAEIPAEWAAACARFTRSAAPFLAGGMLGRNLPWLVWQTAVGAWPLSAERLLEAVLKAAREAHTDTSWTAPNKEFENALATLARAVATECEPAAQITRFVDRIAPAARSNTLAAQLLQLAMPGVPDIYQGGEAVLLTLVDPDNRRPVDHARLARLLDGPAGAAATPDEEKARLTAAALGLRRDRPAAFASTADGGGYRPLPARGPAARHLLAFARGGRPGPEAVAAVTRLPLGLAAAGGWRGTRLALPPGTWTDLLTGCRWDGPEAPADELFARLPVALLRRE